jgi:hypothetical protein
MLMTFVAVSTYGSEPSTLKEMKALMCPVDATKQAALKDCMKSKAVDKDKVSKYMIIPGTIS